MEENPKTYKLVVTEEHLRLIKNACEAYFRARMGQFGIMLECIFGGINNIRPEEGERIERILKNNLFHRISFPENGYFGIHHEKVGLGKLAYEIEKVIDNFISVNHNDGYWGMGINYDEPSKLTDTPLPQIEGFNKYKDFSFSYEASKKINKFYKSKKYEQMWHFIDSLKVLGAINFPRGEKSEIVFKKEGRRNIAYLRVHKPRKENE